MESALPPQLREKMIEIAARHEAGRRMKEPDIPIEEIFAEFGAPRRRA
jgi:hypothetical protein